MFFLRNIANRRRIRANVDVVRLYGGLQGGLKTKFEDFIKKHLTRSYLHYKLREEEK